MRRAVHSVPARLAWPAQDRGAVSTEYALLIIFIAVAAVIGIVAFGGAVFDLFDSGRTEIPWPGQP